MRCPVGVILLIASVGVACGGEGPRSTGSVFAPVPAFPTLTEATARDLCATPPGRALPRPTDAVQAMERISGTWLLCSKTGILPAVDKVGLRIEPSGKVLTLRWQDGKLVGAPSGTNVTILPSYPSQANFLVGEGFIPTIPVTTESPRHLATALMSGPTADYVDAMTDPATTPRPKPVCADGAPTQEDVRRACALPDGSHLPLSTLGAFANAISGTWYRCANSVLGGDDDGISLSEDSYSAIQFVDGVPLARFDLWHSGTVELIDTALMNGPGVYQINLDASIGTTIFQPQLSDSPRAFYSMWLGAGPGSIKYVSLPCGATSPLPPPPPKPLCATRGPTPADVQALCAMPPGPPMAVSSVADFQRLLGGVWYRCSAAGLLATAHDGISFDGSSYALVEFDGDVAVRRADIFATGTATVIDPSAMNGPGPYQLDLRVDTGVTFFSHPTLEQSPEALSAASVNETPEAARYVALPCAP
jgi:hypothetical protein